MPFKKPKKAPRFADLVSTLAQSKDIDGALYQTIQEIINRLDQFVVFTKENIIAVGNGNGNENGSGSDISVLPLHAPSHQTGGGDIVNVTQLGGFTGGTTNFLRADRTFAAPPGGTVPGAHATTHQPSGGDPMAVDAASGTGSLRTLGTGANQAAPGNDARFTAPSTPTIHASTHSGVSSDPVDLRNLFGFPGGTTSFLRADATFAAPSAVPSAHHTTHETGGTDAIVALSGTVITTGIVADARLSSNVAFENQSNDFTTGFNTFSGTDPKIRLNDTSGALDQKDFTLQNIGSELNIKAYSDDQNQQATPLRLLRDGSAIVQTTLTATGGLNTTPLNATNLTSGTVPDARLSANVQMKPIPVTDLPNHATRHSSGGADPVTVTNLAGYPGGVVNFLRADGTFAAPPTGGIPGAHASTHNAGGADVLAIDSAAAVGSLRTLGTGANQATAGNDSRLTNSRTPTVHATTHSAGQSDPVTVTALAGYPGGTANFLRADGTFAAPPTGGVPSAHHTEHEPGGSDVLANNAWTNVANTFTENQTISKTFPTATFNDTSAAADFRRFDIVNASGALTIQAKSDAGVTQSSPFYMTRTSGGTAIAVNLSATGSGGNVACKDQANIFTQNQTIDAATPRLKWLENDQPADQRRFEITVAGQEVLFQCLNDAETLASGAIKLSRSGDVSASRDVYEKGRTVPIGHWTDVPYSAGNFTCAAGTWTVGAGSQSIFRYTVIGKTIHISLYLVATTLSTASGTVSVKIPGGFSSSYQTGVVAYKNPGAGYAVLFPSAGTNMVFYKDLAGTGWASGTLELMGQFTFSIA